MSQYYLVVFSTMIPGLFKSHRMAEVGRNVWRPSGPTTLLKQEHPQQAAQDHVWKTRAFILQENSSMGQNSLSITHPNPALDQLQASAELICKKLRLW